MVQLVFNDQNVNWSPYGAVNVAMLDIKRRTLCSKYEERGYLYLNEIYAHLGFKWNPFNENVGWYNGKPLVIDFKPIEGDNEAYLITIY